VSTIHFRAVLKWGIDGAVNKARMIVLSISLL
jgi:hypothetical protein